MVKVSWFDDDAWKASPNEFRAPSAAKGSRVSPMVSMGHPKLREFLSLEMRAMNGRGQIQSMANMGDGHLVMSDDHHAQLAVEADQCVPDPSLVLSIQGAGGLVQNQ